MLTSISISSCLHLSCLRVSAVGAMLFAALHASEGEPGKPARDDGVMRQRDAQETELAVDVGGDPQRDVIGFVTWIVDDYSMRFGDRNHQLAESGRCEIAAGTTCATIRGARTPLPTTTTRCNL